MSILQPTIKEAFLSAEGRALKDAAKRTKDKARHFIFIVAFHTHRDIRC
jgi:hypothetical protein